MDLFNRDVLRRLAEQEDEVCISIFMPIRRDEANWSQNPTRLKNLLREARDELRDRDFREDRIDEILGDARQLLDRPNFWREGIQDGLALFITSSTLETFRLPLDFDEVSVVADGFHLKPLFPLIAANNRFYVLALSQNDVRLYQGTHQSISELTSADLPRDLVDALQQSETPSQAQSVPRENPVQEDGQAGTEYGGDPDDMSREPKEELKRFFREVDDSVSDYIGGENVPLLLAGVSEYLPVYRELNSYSHLVEDDLVAGNPESLRMDRLHERAWEVVAPVFREAQEKEADRFEQLFYQKEQLASDSFHEILPACTYGRVDTLFVPGGEYRWGQFDPESNTIEIHDARQSGDVDLLNQAAVSAYLNGGTVHVLQPTEMPGGRSIAATFRYRTDVAAEESG